MARLFTGVTGDNVNLGNPTQLDPSSLNMTVCCWVNPTASPSTTGTYISRAKAVAANRGWLFGQTSGLAVLFAKRGATTATSTITLTAGQWVFVAAVVKATTVRFVKIAPDGTLTANDQSNSSAFVAGADDCYLGHDVSNSTTTNFLKGRLAEVGVWIGSQLTDTQLQAVAFDGLFAAGVQPTYAAPLLGDSPEPDYSGNGISGTVTGTTVVAHPPVYGRLLRPAQPAVRPTAAAFTGAAALAGAGTLTAAGTPKHLAAAALAGAGTLTAVGLPNHAATAALAGTGALTAAATASHLTAAALAGTGTLTADGTSTITAAAALTGAGTLAAAGTDAHTGAAALSGVGTLIVDTGPPTGGHIPPMSIARRPIIHDDADAAAVAVAVAAYQQHRRRRRRVLVVR